MLEFLLANLPDITDPEMPAERGNLLLEALETPPAIPLFESPPDQSAHSKKRQMNSSSSGEPSLLMIPTYPGTKWSSSLGKNPSFLEDEQVEAFTAVTHIRETHKPEPLARPKRPKKPLNKKSKSFEKRTKNSSYNFNAKKKSIKQKLRN